ncbi:MAG: transcription antitermination factor NusB [Anaerolineae bacterium]
MDDQRKSGFLDFEPDDVVESEVIEHPTTTNERSLARQVALQVLYEVDSAGHPVGEVITGQLEYHQLSERASKYMRGLVLGVLERRTKLDQVIQRFAPEWPLAQVAIVDRNILRISVYEFAVDDQTPVKVAIDEAVELAKLFGAEGTPRFVNGVLGSLTEDLDTIREMLKVD